MDSRNDKTKPGQGIDGNKDVGFQTRDLDREALAKMYGEAFRAPKTGPEAGK